MVYPSTEEIDDSILMSSVAKVVVGFYPQIGGSITHTSELSLKIGPYLKKQVIFAPDLGDISFEIDQNYGVNIKRVRYPRLKKFLGIPIIPLTRSLYMINVFIEIIKNERPDIIHTYGADITAIGVIIGKLLGIPVIATFDGTMEAYSKLDSLLETMLATIFKPDHAIVADDGSNAPKKFNKIFGKDKITIVNHAIDIEKFKPRLRNRELLSQMSLSESDFIILSTSSLAHVKRIDLAIRSFKIFLEKIKVNNAYLLIAGKGDNGDLIALAKSLSVDKNIKFLGGINADEIPDYLSIADIVIASSLYSNLNLSVQEAMAFGKPVVTFNSGRTGDLIKNMENGLLANSNDLEHFAKNLVFLYGNSFLRKKLGNEARNTIIKDRRWDVRIQKELSAYRKLLNEQK